MSSTIMDTLVVKSTLFFSKKVRKKRFNLFNSLIASVSTPIKILDIGGTPGFWEIEGFCEPNKNVEIVILNLEKVQVSYPNFKSVKGDARDIKQFKDNEFDVVFSNSVIEHVGSYEEQRRMANEVRRLGKKYFLQTPNHYFPIEPHFLFPFFQFFPVWVKVWLVTNFDIGWFKKIEDKQKAISLVNSVTLLTKKQLIDLFPTATLVEEKVLGLTKSFMVYEGWETTPNIT